MKKKKKKTKAKEGDDIDFDAHDLSSYGSVELRKGFL